MWTAWSMRERMEGGQWPEWKVLDLFYSAGLVLYLLVQWMTRGGIQDGSFLLLLTAATFFVNYRQQELYRALVNEEGQLFFGKLYGGEDAQRQVNTIFLSKSNDRIALLFAAVFVVVMWQFNIWNDLRSVKISFDVYLFAANIPTGLAIVRLIQYFRFSIMWIQKIDFGLGIEEGFEVRYVKKIRNKVIYTAVIYCTVSLSSILFTNLELNLVVALYTIFAIILILTALLVTDIMIGRKKQECCSLSMEAMDEKIEQELRMIIFGESVDTDRLEAYTRVKEYLSIQFKKRFDLSSIMSGISFLMISIIPIVLQSILEKWI